MRETHPIDELFREKLQYASAIPPAHIGEAVLAAVRSKRRAAIWRRSAAALLFLLLLIGGGVTWNVLRTGDQQASASPDVEQTARGSEGAAIGAEDPDVIREETREGAAAIAHTVEPASTSEAPNTPSGIAESTVVEDRPAANTSTQNKEESHSGQVFPPVLVDVTSKPDPSIPPQAQLPSESTLELFVREPVTIDRMSVVELDRSMQPSPESAALCAGPVLPGGEWWVAPSAGIVASRYSWSGGANELAAALDRSRGWSNDFALGLFGGRAWRSGLVFSGGVEWQRSEQLFSSTERVTTMENTAVDFVTLNTQVIAADTAWAVVEQELTAEGTDRRSVVRIPAEVAWHQGLRRWFAGPRVGIAGELTRARASSSLVWNEEDERIRSGILDSDAQRQRYPFAVLGVVGLDLGFLLNERVSILAAPSYYLPLLDLGRASETHAAAEHLGLRVQLRHTF